MKMEMMKNKSKIETLKALIAQMHKAMMGGDGDKTMNVENAIESAENDLGMGNGDSKEPADDETAEPGFADQVKAYMKKSGSSPVKGKTAFMMKSEVKKPMIGKKKYG